jgi:Arc/MetJ family transcription regulator
MRTNIVIDDQLIAAAMRATGLETKRAVVDAALRLLVDLSRQEKIRKLRGKVDWKGNLDESRAGRFLEPSKA